MVCHQLVIILFSLFAGSFGSLERKSGPHEIEKLYRIICQREAGLLHEAYQAAFNAGNLDGVLKFYDVKGGYYHFDEKNKLLGRDAVIPSLTQLMSHGGEIAIDAETMIVMKRKFHEFYVYGKMMRRSNTQGSETIFYKQRIIRIEKHGHGAEAEYRLWTEHLAHAPFEVKPIPYPE